MEPVHDDSQLSRGAWDLHEMDAAGCQPPRKAAEAQAPQVSDALSASEGGHLAKRLKAVRLKRPSLVEGDKVLAQPTGLA